MPHLEIPVAYVPRAAHRLPGRLGFAPAPGRWQLDERGDSGEALEEDLRCLRNSCGASVLVTLLEEEEMARYGLAGLLDCAMGSGLESLWFPIQDGTAPSDLDSTALLIGRILERLAAGETVIVHCLGGVGRSGTIVACALVAAGLDPRRALEVVRDARPGAATAPGQSDFVYQFARARASWAGTRPPV